MIVNYLHSFHLRKESFMILCLTHFFINDTFRFVPLFYTLGHDFFICWITFHFQEFQSEAIGTIKLKIELKPKMYKIIITLEVLFVK